MPRGATAQGWLEDPSATQGRGIELGAITLHPGFGAEFGWDGNVYYSDANPDDRLLMRLTAHLRATTQQVEEETRRVQFDGGLNASFYHFFGESTRDNVALGANVGVHVRPDANVSFRIEDRFARSIQPFVDGLSALRYARDRNTADAELHFRSDSDILRGFIGYQLYFDFFEDRGDLEFNYAQHFAHSIRTGLYWAFLPHTGFVYEGQVSRVNYPNRGDGEVLVSDGWRLRQEVGINGVLTKAVSLTAMIGYSAGFFNAGDDYGTGVDALTSRLEGRFRLRESLSFTVGYQRSYQPSFIGNFAQHDRIYAGSQFVFGGAFILNANVAITHSKTGQALQVDGMTLLGSTETRDAWRLQAGLYSEYRFTQWLALTAQVSYIQDITDYTYSDSVAEPLVDPAARFRKFQLWLGLRVFY